MSLRTLAKSTGLNKDALHRHSRDHVQTGPELLEAVGEAVKAGDVAKATTMAKDALAAIEGAPERILREIGEAGRLSVKWARAAAKVGNTGPASANIGNVLKSLDQQADQLGIKAPVKQQVEHSGQVGVIVLPAEDREWVPGAVVEAQTVAADASTDAVARQLLEPGDPLREWWSREVERGHLVITGAPRTGKTTLADALGARLGVRVLHTDDLQHLGWGADSDEGAKWMLEAEPWIIEGTAAVRSLRKHVKAGGGERPVCIYLTAPRVQQTAGQVALARGIETIWLQVVEAVERIQPPRELA